MTLSNKTDVTKMNDTEKLVSSKLILGFFE